MTSSNSNAFSWLLDISRYSSYNKKSLQTNYLTYLIEKGGGGGRHGHYRKEVGFTTNYSISTYHL